MKLYFSRHGQSEANVLREFSNADHKHPLTALGVQQAQALAAALAGKGIARIYSSPVLRAVQTAGIVATALGLPVTYTEALREWSVGVLEGTRDPAGWELYDEVQAAWFYDRQLERKIPGGESFLEIQARFTPFIEALLAQPPDGDILLVGHGGLYRAMLPVIFSNVSFEFALNHAFPNTAYALAETRPPGLVCLEWCGTPLETQAG